MSPDEYRYTLTRVVPDPLDQASGDLVWVMLNPSTADQFVDDPTIRRVIGFTRREGFATLTVVNLFARRCTRPIHLTDPGDPVGPANGMALHEAISHATHVVCAWGAWIDGQHHGIRSDLKAVRPNVEAMIKASRATAWCLGVTAHGSPRHPLYVRSTQPMEVYPL